MFLNYILAVLSVLLFLYSFFPIPPRPLYEGLRNEVTSNEPKYQKVVIIVIDALRTDFVTNSTTPFLWKSFQNKGCFIHLNVETPTVTLPRIKAITTGNVPQFIDIVLNFASPVKVEDSFIHRAHASGKKIVFYRDDIWTRLFPEHFMRSEGTSSFFVNDFFEVDDNVTRNVRIEIGKTDWHIMVLHYLGLDHIGHVFGPKSPLIGTKLLEMDSIIEEIYNTIDEDTFVLVTGDHGMRDSGGHGGSTYPETHVPLIFLGINCKNDTFAQIDIAANLAILLGFDIPTTSIGQLQKSLLFDLTETQYLKALKYNSYLLKNKLDLFSDEIETASYFLDLHLLNKTSDFGAKAENIFLNCSRMISQELKRSSVKQNHQSLVVAVLVAIFVLLQIGQGSSSRWEQITVLILLILQFFNVDFSIVFILMLLALCLLNLKSFAFTNLKGFKPSFITVVSILHPLSFLSSSYLEEEQEFWYFFTSTLIFLTTFDKGVKIINFVGLLFAIRFVRTINQVGDKWAAVPDLADWLLKTENYVFLQIFFILGLLLSLIYNLNASTSALNKVLDSCAITLIYIFRMILNQNVNLGRILWFLIFLRLTLCILRKNSILQVWVLVANLLLKPHNVILVSVCLYASQIFHKTFKEENLIILHWWFGNLLFFAQGHDNSLASVDISSGYIGLSQYEPLFVVPQVLCHTYALTVLSQLLLFSKNSVNCNKALSIIMLLRLYVVVIVFIVTFIQRHHLFIWSVFAPKMFVEASHLGFLFIEISCYYLGSLIKSLL